MHPVVVPCAVGPLFGDDDGLLLRGFGDGGGGKNCNSSGGKGGHSVNVDFPVNRSSFDNNTRTKSRVIIVSYFFIVGFNG